MPQTDPARESRDDNIQDSILEELKRTNELLEMLLKIQNSVQSRQRKFWFMALSQVVLLLLVVFWWGFEYGF